MALNKYHYIELDTKRSPRISLQNIVAGETGNRIWVTLTNGGTKVNLAEKEDSAFIYRVCLRVDSALGTRRQDSAMENSGITLIDDDTSGDYGKCNIRLSKDSFTAGLNRCRLEIYSKTWVANDTLICSAEFQFTAAGNPTGENAGNVYPSLIALEEELATLKTETVAAKEAALSAAESAEYEAGQASTEATLAGQKAALAGAAATAANTAAATATTAANKAQAMAEAAEEAGNTALAKAGQANTAAAAANTAASTLNGMLENIDEEPTIDSNNLVKSGGVHSAIQAVEAANPFSIVPLSVSAWSGISYSAVVDEDAAAFADRAQHHNLICVIKNPDGDYVILYEYYRVQDMSYFALRSPKDTAGYYYEAYIGDDGVFDALRTREQIPASASVSNGTVTFKDNLNNTLFSFALPVYNGGVSDDE